MLMQLERSAVLVVDFQERLMPAIHQAETVMEQAIWLIQVAQQLQAPILASEQYPHGLGPTVAPIRALLSADVIMEKTHFSCVAEPECRRRIDALGRDQIIVMGAEAHVCVLQTALGLHSIGKAVYLVADAVGSRSPRNVELALERMRAVGISIVSREMVAFEWLHEANTERFRAISRAFLR